MKKIVCISIILLALFVNVKELCAQNSKSTLYYFHASTDTNFCSVDSLIKGDCIAGNIYLTNTGKSIYFLNCCCENPIVYNIGTYVLKNKKITCTFNKEFTVGDVLKKTEPWMIEITAVNCKLYPYQFFSTLSEEGGVTYKELNLVKLANKKATIRFIKEIKKYKL
jgi:hypothetical protein